MALLTYNLVKEVINNMVQIIYGPGYNNRIIDLDKYYNTLDNHTNFKRIPGYLPISGLHQHMMKIMTKYMKRKNLI
jgi:hypothetical protein